MKRIGVKSMFKALVLLCLAGPRLIAQPAGGGALQQYSEEGQKALAAGRYDEAERAYEKLRALVPGIAEVHAQLGLSTFNPS